MHAFFRFAPFLLLLTASAAAAQPTSSTMVIDKVWSGHPVSFCLLTHGERQYAAYYDAERRMTVASCLLSSTRWEKVHLPEKIGWDSHNYITMVPDDDGHLHLSGNMHNHPLKYFRTTRPRDIASFERVTSMTGQLEKKCTYPRFFRGADNELIFTYRSGSSGNGIQVYNVYDHITRAWRRMHDKPLTDGEGLMSAYLHGPRRGPDGYYHLVWVWRDTPDCATNHSLSYARSRNLVNWETSTGSQLLLPMTLANSEIVDPTPPGGGLLNGVVALGFDSNKRPIITYHKYDSQGRSQIWNARQNEGGWEIVQATEWDWRLDFSGGGSIGFPLRIGAVSPGKKKGDLSLTLRHPKRGGTYRVDEASLKLKETPNKKKRRTPKTESAAARERPPADSAGIRLETRTAGDSGKHAEPGVSYKLRWQTLPANRDLPREGSLPEPSVLELVRTEK